MDNFNNQGGNASFNQYNDDNDDNQSDERSKGIKSRTKAGANESGDKNKKYQDKQVKK